MTSVTWRSIVRAVQCDAKELTLSRNGTTVPATSMRLAVVIFLCEPSCEIYRIASTWQDWEEARFLQEPASNVFDAHRDWLKNLSITRSNGHVQLRVVGILTITQTVCCDHVADCWDIQWRAALDPAHCLIAAHRTLTLQKFVCQ